MLEADPASSNPLQRVLDLLARIGADPADSDEVRLQKMLMVTGRLLGGAPAVALWGLNYLSLGEGLAGWLILSTALSTLLLVVLFGLTRRFGLFRLLMRVLLLVAPFAITAALGGILNGSAFFLLVQLAPLQALMCYSSPRPAAGWLLPTWRWWRGCCWPSPIRRRRRRFPAARNRPCWCSTAWRWRCSSSWAGAGSTAAHWHLASESTAARSSLASSAARSSSTTVG